MKFKFQINSALFPENQYSKKLWQDGALRPEMDCVDYRAMEAYYRDLASGIRVDDSIDDWTLSMCIYLGGAMGETEIVIGRRGITYLKDKEKCMAIAIPLPTAEEIPWGIVKKHRFNQYAKRESDRGVTLLPAAYDQYETMTDYIETSIKLALRRALTDGFTLKGHKIKL